MEGIVCILEWEQLLMNMMVMVWKYFLEIINKDIVLMAVIWEKNFF